MPKQALNRWMPSNVAELRDALAEILTDIACEGAHPDTVYVDVRDIALVRETLTDGSAVFNIVMRESLPARDDHVSTSKAAAFVSQVAAHRPGYDTYVGKRPLKTVEYKARGDCPVPLRTSAPYGLKGNGPYSFADGPHRAHRSAKAGRSSRAPRSRRDRGETTGGNL